MKKLIKNKFILFSFAFVLGLGSSFSLPPYNFYLINFLTFNFFFIFLINKEILKNKIDFFYYGWLFGFGYFISSLYWITISLTFDSDFIVLIPLAIIVIPGFLAIFFALPTFIFSFFLKCNILVLVLIFSILFGSFEFLRGNILTGFPWNLFVFSFSNNLSFLQSLSIFGTYGLNLICITFFLIPSIFILKKTNFELIASVILSLILILFLSFGKIRLIDKNNSVLLNDSFVIKIISSRIEIERFYNAEKEIDIVNQLIKLSKPNKNLPTVFIWPEGIFTSSFLEDIKKYKDLFEKNFQNDDLIILGINDIKYGVRNDIYNSLVILDNKLNIISLYHKNKLVPFGEFLPAENFLKKTGLRKVTNNYQSFSKGKVREIINIKNLKILPLICYEIIYSGKLSNNNNYDLIINISEDGWFGQSIGPSQHFTHSIFRSIEEGKNIIRSSNNGTSALINYKGEILKLKESTESGVIEVSYLEKSNKMTFFSKYKNNIFFYLLSIYISLIFFLKRIGR